MRRIELYANRDHALNARKKAATTGNGLGFGLEARAAQDFFDDAWAVWGDARKIISAHERSVLVWKLLEEQQVLGQTLGTLRLLEGFLEQAAGLFDSASLVATETTSEVLKNTVVCLAETYYKQLSERGFIEAGEAAAILSHGMPKTEVRLAEYVDVLPAQRRLFEKWNVDVSLLDAPVSLESLAFEVKPSILVAAGASAVNSLIKEEIEAYISNVSLLGETELLVVQNAKPSEEKVSCLDLKIVLGDDGKEDVNERLARAIEEATKLRSVLVLAKRPGEIFRALTPYLYDCGMKCSLQESVAFLDTWVGKACASVQQVLRGSSRWLFSATDFAYNPLSGMSRSAAEALNTLYRGDRRLTVADVRKELEQHSTYLLFEALLTGKGYEGAFSEAVDVAEVAEIAGDTWPLLLSEKSDQSVFDIIRDLVACQVPLSERDCEFALLDELSQVVTTMKAFGLCPLNAFDLLQDLTITCMRETSEPDNGCGQVLFAPLSAVSKLEETSYGLVIWGDVSTDAFALTTERSSLEAFASQLGIDIDLDPLQDARRLFEAAQKAAIKQFTCVQLLHNEALEETFPSCIYDEYCSLLTHARVSSDSAFDLDATKKLRGEEHLNQGLGASFALQSDTHVYDEAIRGVLTYAPLLAYLPTDEEGTKLLPVLSASALEAYLNCPYRWFSSYGLNLSLLDEGYDSRTKGTFVHQVLATFFAQLKDRGVSLSREHLMPDGLFDQVFNEAQVDQWIRTHDRLIALTEAEKGDMELLRESLRRSLSLQLDLPSDYDPTYFEYRISPDERITYAGSRLRGSIDRVDVNAQTGDFVILDYKNSAGGHEAPYNASEFEGDYVLPSFVQSLIYAQAVRRKGFEGQKAENGSMSDGEPRCAGALYLGYKAKTKKFLLAGSYDRSRYDVMEYVAKDSQVKGDFSCYLDLVEQSIEPYVQALVAGKIAGDPRDKDSCKYCVLAGRGKCAAQRGVRDVLTEHEAQEVFESSVWEVQ